MSGCCAPHSQAPPAHGAHRSASTLQIDQRLRRIVLDRQELPSSSASAVTVWRRGSSVGFHVLRNSATSEIGRVEKSDTVRGLSSGGKSRVIQASGSPSSTVILFMTSW